MSSQGAGGRSRSNSTDKKDESWDEDDIQDPHHLTDDFISPMSPVGCRGGTSGRNATNANELTYSPAVSERNHEQELLDFLVSPGVEESTNSQRLGRSVDHLDFNAIDSNSGRASRSIGGSRSLRRERTVGSRSGSRSRASSTRESASNNVNRSTSSNKRPPRSSRGIGRSKSDMDGFLSPMKMKPPRHSSDNPTDLPTNGTEASPHRGAPPRSKSASDGPGELGDFFSRTNDSANQQVSRRKKPTSGNRSVVSMPTRTRRVRVIKTSAEAEDTKQPSSRTTVTGASTDTYGSDEEDFDESIAESIEEHLNDIGSRAPSSSRSVGDVGGGGYIDPEGLEAARQMHMSRTENLLMDAARQMHMSRTENLLFDVFPKHIAEALRSGRKVAPENHECVTIFFSDIVGFTNISSELDPMKVSDMLDRLYNSFDALSHYHDV
jgi:Adenylate and Guanylate cyclase catalytic domain